MTTWEQDVVVNQGVAQVRIVKRDIVGPAEVVVNGVDYAAHTRSVQIAMTGTDLTTVTLHMLGAVDFEGPGIVYAVRPAIEQDAEAWARQTNAWLQGLDWNEMQRRIADGAMTDGIGVAVHDAMETELARTMKQAASRDR
jgi:hypothetical protein